MYHLDHLPGRTLRVAAEEWLYFSGTSYLGLTFHPLFLQRVQEAMQRYGGHFGGSRRSNLQLEAFEKAEVWLANFTGAAQGVVCSSGTLAGQLLTRVLAPQGTWLMAPGLHPALWTDELPLAQSWEQWVELALDQSHQPGPPLFLVANSLDPLQVRRFDFGWLPQLGQRREVHVVLDDSHGLGVTGKNGGGILGLLPPSQGWRLTVVCSLGKAFGLPAGVVLGDLAMRNTLVDSAFFGGASPPPPAYLAALCASTALIYEQRERLASNVAFFAAQLPNPKEFRTFSAYPVFFIPDDALATFLAENRVLISSFPYPSPQDPCITRVVINAGHRQEDLEHLSSLLNRYFLSQKP